MRITNYGSPLGAKMVANDNEKSLNKLFLDHYLMTGAVKS